MWCWCGLASVYALVCGSFMFDTTPHNLAIKMPRLTKRFAPVDLLLLRRYLNIVVCILFIFWYFQKFYFLFFVCVFNGILFETCLHSLKKLRYRLRFL